MPIAPIMGGVATGVLAVTSTFATDDGPVLCLFRICTGGYCPGCGGSRAAVALLRGDVGAAWVQHPWIVVIAFQIVALAFVWFTPGRSNLQRRTFLKDRQRLILLSNAGFGVALWLLRLTLSQIPIPFG